MDNILAISSHFKILNKLSISELTGFCYNMSSDFEISALVHCSFVLHVIHLSLVHQAQIIDVRVLSK